MRVRVPQMLAVALTVFSSNLLTALKTPALHAVKVLVHAVLSPQPFPLTYVAGQHVSFGFEDRRSVDDERGLDGVAVPIRALDRIDIV